MRPPLLHAKFFSSLKQVEKRLKSENPSSPRLRNLSASTSTDHLSSPIYINYDDQPPNNSPTFQGSDPPQEFLSHSPEFPPTQEDPPQSNIVKQDQTVDVADKDDIERLMELLGLSEYKEQEAQKQRGECKNLKSGSCFCHDEFYSKTVGVKGPKCEKEMGRLDGWIKYYLSGNGGDDAGARREPLRLVHLLLGKAACASEEDSDGFGEFEFPSTIQEFLENDPPTWG